MDVVEFLTARLDEDEADAVAARDKHQGVYATTGDAEWRNSASGDGIYTEPHGINVAVGGFGFLDDETANHITRHDPARVLREVAAKRAIVEDYQLVAANNMIEKATGRDEVKVAARELIVKSLRMVLLRLAAPYADHPDYDESWRP